MSMSGRSFFRWIIGEIFMKSLAKYMLRLTTLAGVIATASFTSALQAQTSTDGWQTSGDLTLVSDYLYRGISQTNEGLAAQGTLSLSHQSGWYASAWTSNIGFGDGSLELDLFAGRKWAVAELAAQPLTLDVGLMQYRYPQGHNSSNGFNFIEAYSKLGWQHWTLGLALTDNYFGAGVGKFAYLTLDWQHALSEQWLLQLHLGHNQFSGATDVQAFLGSTVPARQHYQDYSLLLQTSLLGLNLAAGVAGTNVSTTACAELCDDRVLLKLSRSF